MPGDESLAGSPMRGRAGSTPAHILVVDDDGRNARLMQIVLRSEGYRTSISSSGPEALALLVVDPVDLIVLDVMMPGMSGYDVCRQIRENKQTFFLPVILVTALTDATDRVEGIEAGADDFISKPFNEVEIRARVRSLLRIKALHDQLERRNDLLLDALQRAVSPGVADQILDDPDRYLRPGGERRSVSILFGDLRGYTSLAEELPPQEAMVVLNTYLSGIIEAVYTHGGTVNQILGDGVMSLFGAPIGYEDHGRRAVLAALEMQRLVGAVRIEGFEAVRLQMGIGINTGDVVVGHIGSEQRMDYTAVGDAVNLAARFEQNAGPGQVLVTQATYDLIADQFDVHPIGTLRAKGREGWAPGYSVLRERLPTT
jgi:adenylate cyclase